MQSGTQKPKDKPPKTITERALDWLRLPHDRKAEGEVTAWIQRICQGGGAIGVDRKLNEDQVRILEGIYSTIEIATHFDPNDVMPHDNKGRARAVGQITTSARRLSVKLKASRIPIPSALDLFDRHKLQVMHSRIVGDRGLDPKDPTVRAHFARQIEGTLASTKESVWGHPQELAEMLDHLVERIEQFSNPDHPSVENARLARDKKALLAVLLNNFLKAKYGEAPHKFIAACICLTYSEDHTKERDVAGWLQSNSHNLI